MSHIDLHPDELFDALRAGRLAGADARRLRAHCAQCEACTMELAWAEAGLHKSTPNGDDQARAARAVAGLLRLDLEPGEAGASVHPATEAAPSEHAVTRDARVERPANGGHKRPSRRRQLAMAMVIVAVSGSSAAALWTEQPLYARLRILVGQIVLTATEGSEKPLAARAANAARKVARQGERGLGAQARPVPPAIPVVRDPTQVAPMASLTAAETPPAARANEGSAVPSDSPAPRPARALPGAAEAAKGPTSVHADVTAGRMLRRAAELRAAGESSAAAQAYGEVQQRFPRGRSAQAARIAQGNLYLHQLQSPERSVAAFAAYLMHDPRGPLAEEALNGMATAYARLGRPAHEAQTWQRLLSAHPHSLYAQTARRRLVQLLDEGSH